ncbi:MAG: type II restriction endonuclease [Balneolaceae bacterium]
MIKAGYLSDHFVGVGAKRLTKVEVDGSASNQHEFQGINRLKKVLGTPIDKVKFDSVFYKLTDDKEIEFIEGFSTWSDVRRDNDKRSAEYHLYYSSDAGSLVQSMSPDDLLIVARKQDDGLSVFLCEQGSSRERQLMWLFGLSENLDRLEVQEIKESNNKQLLFAARSILDELGIEIETADDNWLERILSEFGNKFPTTRLFSEFARETVGEVSVRDDPDGTIMSWIEHEEMLFRTLERHIVSERIDAGFENDVDSFISFSLSVQNRRKSRVGHALEHHLEEVFRRNEIPYTRGGMTENRAKPDFLFPGVSEYHDSDYLESSLYMLGVKSTCKDRWRQVLSEANRIKDKHLFTLEPGISVNQTNEMQASSLLLVLPKDLHITFEDNQQSWLMSLGEFVEQVRNP